MLKSMNYQTSIIVKARLQEAPVKDFGKMKTSNLCFWPIMKNVQKDTFKQGILAATDNLRTGSQQKPENW